jgi:hypothetical protein
VLAADPQTVLITRCLLPGFSLTGAEGCESHQKSKQGKREMRKDVAWRECGRLGWHGGPKLK